MGCTMQETELRGRNEISLGGLRLKKGMRNERFLTMEYFSEKEKGSHGSATKVVAKESGHC
jgi:hypothetical protein